MDTCTNCGFDLESGYQSSDNLNLCQACAEYDKQTEAESDSDA